MKERMLITGITGQVGSHLADYVLAHSDFEIVGMMRWQEPLDNLYHLTDRINKKDRLTVHYADLNDSTSLMRLLNLYRPSYISHLAAQSFPKTSFDLPIETLQTNVLGTANLLENIRILRDSEGYDPTIHICSSSEVYGKAKKGVPITEETELHGSSPYSISKIGTDYLGRFYGEAYGMKTFITRMGTHSGPRRSDVFFESTVAKQIALIETGLQEPTIRVGNLESIRTYQDCRDAVRAYFLLMQACNSGRLKNGDFFNIAGKDSYRLNEVISLLLSFSHFENIEILLDEDRLRPLDADYQMFSSDKLLRYIDWTPEIDTKQMFRDLLNHWRHQINNGKVPLNR